MLTFLLVHGSSHGAWCWEKIVPRLEALGHRTLALDLPGHGADDTPWWRVTLGAYSRTVREAARGQGSVIAVGHSMGGGVITQAANEEPDLFAGLIYIAGLVPQPGEAMLSLIRRDPIWRGLKVPRYHAGTITVRPERVIETFYSGCDPADATAAAVRLSPQPLFPFVQRITKPQGPTPPMAYVECLEDRTLSLDLQRYMHTRFTMSAVSALDCDHSPFYSAPADLVRHLAAHALMLTGLRPQQSAPRQVA